MWTSMLICLILVALAQGQGAPLPSIGQYHIQTDQGPTRFFRFQTNTGQYRSEQRHPNGDVTGTYGWVDPNGVLRLFDYISDAGGYRIEQQRLFKVGAALENRLSSVPSRGNEPISLGFEITPLEPGLAVVDINPQSGVPPAPIQASSLVNIYEPNTNPLSKQGQATLLTVPGPVVPAPPPPRIVVVEEEEPPVVIGSAGTQLPDPPKPRSKFVIGAAANGSPVSRPLGRSSQPAVGAADDRPRQISRPAPRRSQTVIGAAAGSSSRPARPAPARARSNDSSSRRDFIVIGLRNNRKRRSFFF